MVCVTSSLSFSLVSELSELFFLNENSVTGRNPGTVRILAEVKNLSGKLSSFIVSEIFLYSAAG